LNLTTRWVFAPVIPNRIRGQQIYEFMKPTPQLSNDHGFPLTDYNYQPTSDPKVTASQITKLTGFHKLSSDFLGTEAVRDFAVEFSAFTVIALVSAWPILSSIVAMFRMLRGY
jgi:hypothetical protein